MAAYGRFNNRPGIGRPNPVAAQWAAFDSRQSVHAGRGHSWRSRIVCVTTPTTACRLSTTRTPTACSIWIAFSFTGDMGCEHGGGVSCAGDSAKGPKQSFLGFMVYNRFWFHKDLYALTIGGGEINNPGRYLVLLPPINGATAISGTPYFTENPGDPYKAWDVSATVGLHAQPVRHVPPGVQPPCRQRALLLRTGRNHASRRQHGSAGLGCSGLDA